MQNNSGIARMYEQNLVAIYDCTSESFLYPDELQQQLGGHFDTRPLWRILEEDHIASPEMAQCMQQRLSAFASARAPQACFADCSLKCRDGVQRLYRMGMVTSGPGAPVNIIFTPVEAEI